MAEFANIAGNRGIEFRELTRPQVGEDVIRIARSKQRDKEVVQAIGMDVWLIDLVRRMRLLARDDSYDWVFPTRKATRTRRRRSS